MIQLSYRANLCIVGENMASDEKLLLTILEKITDISERAARMEVEQRHMKDDLEEVIKQDNVQNKLLAEHIQGVKTANARLDNEIAMRQHVEVRLTKLEEPSKFLTLLKKYVLYVAAVAGAVAALVKIFLD